jgi:predicted LPLAT superfamily acyltransferase
MNVLEGAALREAIVLRVVDELTLDDPRSRFSMFGGARLGMLEAAHALAQTYPQLAERIYAQFGMSGWRK